MKGSFSIDEVFSYGWKTMLKNFGFFVLVIIITGIVGGLLGGLNANLSARQENAAQGLAIVISLIYFVTVIIMQIGVTKISLQIFDGKKTSHAELFTNWEVFGNYVLGSILYGLIVFVGTIFFIVPGVILAIRYRMFSYLIIDKKMNAWAAILESSRITKGQRWQIFAFELPKAIVMITGFLALGVGALFTLPTVIMAETAVYRDLLDRAKA